MSEPFTSALFTLELSVFVTEVGWFGLLGDSGNLLGLTIGHASADEVRSGILKRLPPDAVGDSIADADWCPSLRSRLQKYALGVPTEFDDVDLLLPRQTPFQKRVVAATRRIKFGEIMTYGELAGRAGSPRAARAVGSVMASNKFPIIIPCHRVVASDGKLGGYSAPRGLDLKQQLLDLESMSSIAT